MNKLTPADLARGTLGETWIRDEIAKADMPRFANLRDGGNLPAPRRTSAWLPILIVASVGFWIAVVGVVLCAS